LRLIVAHRDAEGNPLAASRLLFATNPEGVVRRAKRLFGELPAAAPRRGLLATAKGKPSKSQLAPPKPTKLPAPLTDLRVTQFRDYIACPYRFYLRHVLKLEALGDRAAELDGAAFGGLVHLVLEQFGRSEEAAPARQASNPKEIVGYLEYQLDRVVAARYGPQQVRPAVRVQIEQVRLRLLAFAEWQAQRTREGWRIVFGEDSEDRKSALVADFPVDEKPFTLRGRIDRIDYHEGTRKLEVLDYKTADAGEKPEKTHCRGEEWIDLQLPLYRHLLRAAKLTGNVPANAAVSLGYVLLPRSLTAVGLALAEWDEARLRAADERARQIIRDIWQEKFWPPQPGPDFEDDLAVICQDHRLGAARVAQEGDAA
jgi:RecB family exonuclease